MSDLGRREARQVHDREKVNLAISRLVRGDLRIEIEAIGVLPG